MTGRRLIAVVAAGAIAGASSALVALAAFTDHAGTASDPQQPSTLLESADGNGTGTLATAPASPVSGDAAGPAGQAGSVGWVAGRSQPGGGLVAHGVATASPEPAAGGRIGVAGTTWPLTTTPESTPQATPSGSVAVSVPTLPGVPLSTPSGVPMVVTPTSTPTPAPGGSTVTVQVPLPLPTPPPVCVLVICLKP